MPASLDSADRKILIGATAVMLTLAIATVLLGPKHNQRSMGYPSSFASDWMGVKAAYMLLQQSGYHVERWQKSPQELPENSNGAVMIFAEPWDGGTDADRAAISRFLNRGGTVLAMGEQSAHLIPDGSADGSEDYEQKPETFTALTPSDLTRDAEKITMRSPDKWQSHGTSQLAIYGTDEEPVVVSYRVGKGRVIWWASSSPASNGDLREAGNLALFLNSVGPAAGSRILWDEYFHGSRGSLTDYIAQTPLPWALLQIGLAFIALIVTFSRRWGPARSPRTESRLSPLEFVETLGDLYGSAHASPAAIGVAYQRFRVSLARKLGASSKLKLVDLAHRASQRFGWPEQSLLDTLIRSERAMRQFNYDEAEALGLVQQLHDYSARLEMPLRATQEKRA